MSISWVEFWLCGHLQVFFCFLCSHISSSVLFLVHFIMFGCDQRVKIACCKDAIAETHAWGRESKRQRKEAANDVSSNPLIFKFVLVDVSSTHQTKPVLLNTLFWLPGESRDLRKKPSPGSLILVVLCLRVPAKKTNAGEWVVLQPKPQKYFSLLIHD